MAFSLTEQIDNLYTTTWRSARSTVADNIFDHTPLLFWMRRKGKMRPMEGSRRIDVNLEYANTGSATWLTKGGEISLNDPEFLTTAQYDWRYLAGNVERFLQDDLQNRGKFQLVDLVKSKLGNVKMDLELQLETKLFAASGSSASAMDGLQLMVADDPTASTSIGGINQATHTWWANEATNMTGESFATYGLKRMRTMFNNVSKSKGEKSNPDILVSGQNPYEFYEDSLQPQYRFSSRELVDGGFMNLTFKNIPWVWSSSCADTRMYFLNTNHIWMVYDPAAYFEMTEWKEIPDQVRTRVAQIYCGLQMVTNRRKTLGVIYNIDTE